MKTFAQTGMGICTLVLLAVPGYAETTDVQTMRNAMDDNHARMVEAFVDRDTDAFLSCWTTNVVCAVEELPLIRGRDELSKVFLDAAGGAGMIGLDRLNRRIWSCGNFAYETGIYVHRFALTGREQVLSSAKTFVTVWEKQPDGSWQRAAEAWNNRSAPSAEQLDNWRAQPLEEIPVPDLDATPDDRSSMIKMLIQAEQSFHDGFLSDDVEPSLAMYADDARLLGSGADWVYGLDQIRKKVTDNLQQAKLVTIDCDVVAWGGDGQMIYIVNRMHWQFKPAGDEDRIFDFYGKGMHVWQRQSDGKWKILIDINNTNPPPGEGI